MVRYPYRFDIEVERFDDQDSGSPWAWRVFSPEGAILAAGTDQVEEHAWFVAEGAALTWVHMMQGKVA